MVGISDRKKLQKLPKGETLESMHDCVMRQAQQALAELLADKPEEVRQLLDDTTRQLSMLLLDKIYSKKPMYDLEWNIGTYLNEQFEALEQRAGSEAALDLASRIILIAIDAVSDVTQVTVTAPHSGRLAALHESRRRAREFSSTGRSA